MLERLNQLHEESRYQEIVDLIEALPTEERHYEIVSFYGRALNNLDRKKDALAVLETLREQGEQDPVWHWRIGYSLHYLHREEEAAQHFQTAIDLGDDNETLKDFLTEAKQRAAYRKETAEHYETRWKNRAVKSRGAELFDGFDLTDFWDDSDYALETYVNEAPSDELIAKIETELGYKLPQSYIWLMKRHNGGIPKYLNFPTDRPTYWSGTHIAITGIFGIGRKKGRSIGENQGNRFMIEKWNYPDIGVAICAPMIFLDYSHCGKNGEPAVIHIDQENNYLYLADDFESFIRGLFASEPYTADGYTPDRTVTGSAFPSFDETCLLTDMYRDAYYPKHLVDKIRELLLELISFIGKGTLTYEQVQEKLDEVVLAINDLGDDFCENESELETCARESIADAVFLILAHYEIEIDTEQAIREREW